VISGPQRISGIAIISGILVAFVPIIFAPEILATVWDLAEYIWKEIARLRIIARSFRFGKSRKAPVPCDRLIISYG
jgi:hypothetical protein